MRIRSPFLTKLIGWSAAQAMRWLVSTLDIEGHTEACGIDPGVPTIRLNLYSIWHDAIFIPIAMKSRSSMDNAAALVSRHQDGSYLTEFMRHVGVRSFRGSTKHGGVQALRELMRQSERCHIFITPDGPRGPRRKLKDGIVFLASQTGMPIVPVASLCLNVWRVQGSWTDLEIPKPFSKAHYVLGAPVKVPSNLSREELEAYRIRVQAEMDRLAEKLQKIVQDGSAADETRQAA